VKRNQQVESRYWFKIVAFVFTFFVLLLGSGYLLLPRGAPGMVAWMILMVAAIFLLVRMLSKRFAYQCLKCSYTYSVSAIQDYFRPQSISGDGKKVMVCPGCQQEEEMSVVIRKKQG